MDLKKNKREENGENWYWNSELLFCNSKLVSCYFMEEQMLVKILLQKQTNFSQKHFVCSLLTKIGP